MKLFRDHYDNLHLTKCMHSIFLKIFDKYMCPSYYIIPGQSPIYRVYVIYHMVNFWVNTILTLILFTLYLQLTILQCIVLLLLKVITILGLTNQLISWIVQHWAWNIGAIWLLTLIAHSQSKFLVINYIYTIITHISVSFLEVRVCLI